MLRLRDWTCHFRVDSHGQCRRRSGETLDSCFPVPRQARVVGVQLAQSEQPQGPESGLGDDRPAAGSPVPCLESKRAAVPRAPGKPGAYQLLCPAQDLRDRALPCPMAARPELLLSTDPLVCRPPAREPSPQLRRPAPPPAGFVAGRISGADLSGEQANLTTLGFGPQAALEPLQPFNAFARPAVCIVGWHVEILKFPAAPVNRWRTWQRAACRAVAVFREQCGWRAPW